MKTKSICLLILSLLLGCKSAGTSSYAIIKNNVLLDFTDCDSKEKQYDYIQIDITKGFKKEKMINDAFCEYRFLNKDESIIYVSSDIYRGSKLNYKNLYEVGMDGYYPKRTMISDTVKNQGKDAQNLYWLEYVLGDVVIGYVGVSKENKPKFDTIISSVKRLKEL